MQYQDGKIVLEKELNKLDKLIIDFSDVLEEHIDYVLVAGYVAILFGRTRVTEDIDLLIPYISKERFQNLHEDLQEDFWCLNEDNEEELYSLLKSGHALRYARSDEVIPNVEVKFVKSEVDETTLENKISVKLNDRNLNVSSLEMEIAFKEEMLKTAKDREDAMHLRQVFQNNLDEERIKYYKDLLKEHE